MQLRPGLGDSHASGLALHVKHDRPAANTPAENARTEFAET
jgi:hypothetical protein